MPVSSYSNSYYIRPPLLNISTVLNPPIPDMNPVSAPSRPTSSSNSPTSTTPPQTTSLAAPTTPHPTPIQKSDRLPHLRDKRSLFPLAQRRLCFVHQRPLSFPILPLTGHFLPSAAIMVQKVWTVLVPPTGEAIARGGTPPADERSDRERRHAARRWAKRLPPGAARKSCGCKTRTGVL